MVRSLNQFELENFPSLHWQAIAPKLNSECRRALEEVMESLDGGVLTREQCLILANSDGDDFLGLLVAANDVSAANRQQCFCMILV